MSMVSVDREERDDPPSDVRVHEGDGRQTVQPGAPPPCVLCAPCISPRIPGQAMVPRYRLVAIDLDGTALCTDKAMSHAVADGIKLAHSQGAVICVASGRMPFRIMGYASQLPPIFYAASFSGACVFRVEKGEVKETLKEFPVPVPAVNGFLDFFMRHHEHGGEEAFGIYEKDCLYLTNGPVSAALKQAGIPFLRLPEGGLYARFRDCTSAMKLWVFHRPAEGTAQDETITKGVRASGAREIGRHSDACVVLHGTGTGLKGAVERAGAVVISFTESFEIVSSLAGKEHAVAELCDSLGLSLCRDVVAFGDEGNDVALLEGAAHSIAPSGASWAAKRAAKAISLYSNDEDCVGLELTRLFSALPGGGRDADK